MSISYISESIRIRLWGKAAGRCEYEGCNQPLWLDTLTQSEFNSAYIAHIIADKPTGPRGHPALGNELSKQLSEFDRTLAAEVSSARQLEDLENHSDLAPLQRSFRVETLTAFGNQVQHERPWEMGFRCYGVDPTQVLEPFFTRLATESERYLSEGYYTRQLMWETPYMGNWSLAPAEGQFPTIRLVKHFLAFSTIQDLDVETFATGELRKTWGPVQDAVATLLLHTGGKTFVWSGASRLTLVSMIHSSRILSEAACKMVSEGS